MSCSIRCSEGFHRPSFPVLDPQHFRPPRAACCISGMDSETLFEATTLWAICCLSMAAPAMPFFQAQHVALHRVMCAVSVTHTCSDYHGRLPAAGEPYRVSGCGV